MAPLASYRARLNGRRLREGAGSGSTEQSAAISAELRTRCVVRITVRTANGQPAAALGTEFFAGDSLCPALGADHLSQVRHSSSQFVKQSFVILEVGSIEAFGE